MLCTLARLARLDDDARLQARSLADEVVVHGRRSRAARGSARARGRRCGRRGSRMFAPAASAASASSQTRSSARSSPSAPSATRPRGVDRPRLERRRSRRARSCSSSPVEQDRVVDHELARVLGRLVEQVALRADARAHAHHDRLADRVDRRVRHLREQLLEVRVERAACGRRAPRAACRCPSSRPAPRRSRASGARITFMSSCA